MNILHIDSEKSWRGGEQQMAYLMDYIDQHTSHKNFYVYRKGSKSEEFAKRKNYFGISLSFKGLKILNALALKGFCRREKIDLIHVHSANAHTLAYMAALAGNSVPVIVSKRTDFPIKRPGKYNHPAIKAILCVSNKIKEIVQERISHKLVETVYSGVDPQRFDVEAKSLRELLELSADRPLVANTSAIADQKDYFTFVNVARQTPEMDFAIIGSGPMEDEIRSYAKDVPNLYFTGFLLDLPSYMKSIDIFMITSKTEGLGTSILDAMMCKLPVVGTRAGGIPEIVRDGLTGLAADIGDVDTLVSHLNRLSTDDELRSRLVENALEMVQTDFHKDSTAKKTLAIYEQVLSLSQPI